MLSDALRYPLNSDGWLRTILIGGLLTVLSVLVIPAFFLQGYYLRVLRGVANNDPDPPRFDDWVDLFVDGLKLVVVNILVVLTVFVILGLASIVFGGGSLLAGEAAEAGAASGVLGAASVAVIVAASLLFSYIIPAMFTNFAREDSIAAAFDVSTILSGVLTVEYLVAWLLAIIVGVVLGGIASFLSLLVVGIFGLFYSQVVTYYLFGRGFVEGLATNDPNSGATTATVR
jgi:hypothetical protein